MKGNDISLLCDKREYGGNNKASFVKLLSYYNTKEKKVMVVCFGIEKVGNTSDDATQAIDHLLNLFE